MVRATQFEVPEGAVGLFQLTEFWKYNEKVEQHVGIWMWITLYSWKQLKPKFV